jgi:hypothetical protein
MIRVLAAAAATVVLAASPAASGGRGAALTIAATSVQARSSSAAIAWQTSATAKVVVTYGLTDDFGVWSKPQLGTAGQALLAGLEPNTTYLFRLIAGSGSARAESRGTFTTGPIAAWTTATTTANALFLDWQPFFPRMVWRACPSDFAASIAAGINLFMGSCVGGSQQLASLAGKAYSVLDAHQSAGVDGRGLVGWYQPDEADDSGASLAALPPSKQSRRVSFITLSNHFFSAANPLPQGNPSYPKLIAPVDSVGFDLYPLQIWCRTDAFQAVYQAQRELTVLAKGKPTFQWIEAATWNGCAGKPRSPTAQTVRAETWLAIAGGARGIGYFPYYWPAAIGKEITSLNRDIAALAPALLAPETAVTSTGTGVYAGARSFDGARYVIAVNATLKKTTAAFTLPGLGSTVGWVYGESRSVSVRKGTFTDSFAPLAVHIYMIAPAGW